MAFKMKGFSPFTQKVDPDAPGHEPPVISHELYDQLTPDEKKIYNALSADEKVNIDKNTTISQLRNALGTSEVKEDDPN